MKVFSRQGFFTALLLVLSVQVSAFTDLGNLQYAQGYAESADLHSNKFPIGPDPVMTPGKLCNRPTQKRYAEGIDYCDRDVSGKLKQNIIADYDKKLGFQIRTMNRMDFKIDHFIPLSVGGSNDVENLWPQHKSIYAYSDKIESYLSTLMVDGKIKQVEAVRVIKECKLNLSRCADLEDYLKSLMK